MVCKVLFMQSLRIRTWRQWLEELFGPPLALIDACTPNREVSGKQETSFVELSGDSETLLIPSRVHSDRHLSIYNTKERRKERKGKQDRRRSTGYSADTDSFVTVHWTSPPVCRSTSFHLLPSSLFPHTPHSSPPHQQILFPLSRHQYSTKDDDLLFASCPFHLHISAPHTDAQPPHRISPLQQQPGLFCLLFDPTSSHE
jgi:hypothetical protein